MQIRLPSKRCNQKFILKKENESLLASDFIQVIFMLRGETRAQTRAIQLTQILCEAPLHILSTIYRFLRQIPITIDVLPAITTRIQHLMFSWFKGCQIRPCCYFNVTGNSSIGLFFENDESNPFITRFCRP